SVAGDEPHLALLHVGERPEPVELQLEQPVAMVEGVAASIQRERRERRESAAHAGSIRASPPSASRQRKSAVHERTSIKGQTEPRSATTTPSGRRERPNQATPQ